MTKAGKPSIDIINTVLEDCIIAYPVSSFIISLYKHYLKWGTLSKKQLIGLHAKASQIEGIAPGKLAAIETIIKRMPDKVKPVEITRSPVVTKDSSIGETLERLLAAYPNHKRGLFLQSKFQLNESFSPEEMADIKRLKQMLDKK
ncbi:hypothetical protein [Flavihumibacter solisilvae]|uniref:Uncharacterized protein n=1 Tax=Flavihumibacter solisilvae TaxID=1349421 RepID=A0A0C1LBS1_9BACT|nr:hypothetical protein [Flavihumibacter solisilvae]KIC92968.1 hypothetical protein OI18_19635 [Flavihumibacter solisilvae]